jgi:hypothetical protein
MLEAENALTYWRYIHDPVINTFQALLRTKLAKKYNGNGFIAQRLKRAPSIIAKLKREPNMKLSTMQDIAGIRAVMTKLNDVEDLRTSLVNSTSKHILIDEKDYILTPKKSGYRSIHLIFEYSNKLQPDSNGLKIEVQIRTQLQHLWATSVETMGTFLDTSLKSSEGPKPILDFFALTSSAFASIEKMPLVPGCDNFQNEMCLFNEVVSKYDSLTIKDKLSGYSIAVSELSKKENKNSKYHLIILDLKNKFVKIQSYSNKDFAKANIDYTETERSINAGAHMQAVLISIDKVSALQKAYPNYFLDTRDFMEKIETMRREIKFHSYSKL